MPAFKWLANKVLSKLQSWLVGAKLSDFHSGYRAFRVSSLQQIPFEFNSDDFDFDTDILIQFSLAGMRMLEVDIPPYTSNQIGVKNVCRYVYSVLMACLKLVSKLLVSLREKIRRKENGVALPVKIRILEFTSVCPQSDQIRFLCHRFRLWPGLHGRRFEGKGSANAIN